MESTLKELKRAADDRTKLSRKGHWLCGLAREAGYTWRRSPMRLGRLRRRLAAPADPRVASSRVRACDGDGDSGRLKFAGESSSSRTRGNPGASGRMPARWDYRFHPHLTSQARLVLPRFLPCGFRPVTLHVACCGPGVVHALSAWPYCSPSMPRPLSW